MGADAEGVRAELEARGLLLVQDRALPSVVGLVTGEPVRGSWWSHPRGRAIYAVLSELAEHADVLVAKLLSGKDTLVHRALWPALRTVGAAREAWQVEGLSAGARRLLERVDAADGGLRATGAPSRELQLRLLVVARQVHTETGRHATELEGWEAWARGVRCGAIGSAGDARGALEAAALRLGAERSALPW